MYQTFQGNTIHNSGLDIALSVVSEWNSVWRTNNIACPDSLKCLVSESNFELQWNLRWKDLQTKGGFKGAGGNRTFYIDSTSGLWNLVSLKNNSSKLVCSEVRTLSQKLNFLFLVLFSKRYSSAILNNTIPIIEWCLKLSLRVSH